MGKISKSDLPIDRRGWDEISQEFFKHKTEHFATGSQIRMAGKGAGTILAVLTCKCRRADKALRIEWEDGSVSMETPFALNPHPTYH